MAKRRRINDSRREARTFAAGESTTAERVMWLLDNVWGGNRSAMGDDVGCSHLVLVKIAAGQQGPARQPHRNSRGWHPNQTKNSFAESSPPWMRFTRRGLSCFGTSVRRTVSR